MSKPKTSYTPVAKPGTAYTPTPKSATGYLRNSGLTENWALDSTDVTLNSTVVFLMGFPTTPVNQLSTKPQTGYTAT